MQIGNVFDKGPNHPYRILCIGAHSDDIEIGLGGTILRLREAYPQAEWMWAVLSGSGSPREQEAEAGFRIFTEGKNGSLVIKGFRDGFFPVEFGEIKSFFESDLKKFAPDLIFTHYREDRHQDHRITSDLTWNTFRNALILEYEIFKYDGDLGQPNFFVPLSQTQAENKINGLMDAFVSQRSKHWFTPDTFRSLLRLRGIECAYPLAEAFYVRKLVC